MPIFRQLLDSRHQQAKQPGSTAVSESGYSSRSDYNDVATYFIDQKYDGRDAESLTEAEIHGREQAGPSASHSHDTRL